MMFKLGLDAKMNALTCSNLTSCNILCTSNDSSNAPSYTWIGDTNTGMYHLSNDLVGLTAGGVTRMALGSNVNVYGDFNFTGNLLQNGSLFTSSRIAVDTSDPQVISLTKMMSVLKNTNNRNDGQFSWARTIDSSTGSDFAMGIATDSNGNVYVTGYYDSANLGIYEGLNVLSGTAGAFRASNSYAAYIMKLNASGGFLWARTIDSSTVSIGDRAYSVATDSNGNVYVTGLYIGASIIYDGNNELSGSTGALRPTTGTNNSCFILKLDTNGGFVWARTIDNYIGNNITTDSSGNVYVVGRGGGSSGTNGTIYAGDTALGTLRLTSNFPAFLIKLDSTGGLSWARTVESSNTSYGNCTAIDMTGNVYFVGTYNGSSPIIYNGNVELSGSSGALRSTTNNAAFILKLDASGGYVWARTIDDLSNISCSGIASDSSGNVYVIGKYVLSPVIYNKTTGTTGVMRTGTSSTSTIYIIKLDTSGALLWARSIQCGLGSNGVAATTDSNNNVYVAGSYNNTGTAPAIYNGNTLVTSAVFRNSTGDAFFILKLDTSGAFVWSRSIDSSGNDNGYGVALDNSGNVYTSGSIAGTTPTIYNGNVELSGSTGVLRGTNSTTNSAGFILKLSGPVILPYTLQSMTSNDTGIQKILYNMNASAIDVNILNTQGSTLQTLSIEQNKEANLVWVGTEWLVRRSII